MRKLALTTEQAYELALNRQIGGIMPYSLYESSKRPIPRRKAKKRTKAAKIKLRREHQKSNTN